MKKMLLSLVALLGLAASSHADVGMFHVGYSTMVPTGVVCSSNTVIQINASANRPTGLKTKVVGYRIQNQDTANAVWIGGISVSTSAAANLGEMLGAGQPGDSGVWMAGFDIRSGVDVPLYCKAADAAGAAGVKVSVLWFGY